VRAGACRQPNYSTLEPRLSQSLVPTPSLSIPDIEPAEAPTSISELPDIYMLGRDQGYVYAASDAIDDNGSSDTNHNHYDHNTVVERSCCRKRTTLLKEPKSSKTRSLVVRLLSHDWKERRPQPRAANPVLQPTRRSQRISQMNRHEEARETGAYYDC
jgi:hypothetical protein